MIGTFLTRLTIRRVRLGMTRVSHSLLVQSEWHGSSGIRDPYAPFKGQRTGMAVPHKEASLHAKCRYGNFYNCLGHQKDQRMYCLYRDNAISELLA